MRAISAAGIPVGVALAPVIPGLNDYQIPSILEGAKEAGAKTAFMTLLRLPAEVRDVFLKQLKDEYPARYEKVIHNLSEMKGGVLNRSAFAERMRGDGPRWEALRFMFKETCRRLGFNAEDEDALETAAKQKRVGTFHRPQEQLSLFNETT